MHISASAPLLSLQSSYSWSPGHPFFHQIPKVLRACNIFLSCGSLFGISLLRTLSTFITLHATFFVHVFVFGLSFALFDESTRALSVAGRLHFFIHFWLTHTGGRFYYHTHIRDSPDHRQPSVCCTFVACCEFAPFVCLSFVRCKFCVHCILFLFLLLYWVLHKQFFASAFDVFYLVPRPMCVSLPFANFFARFCCKRCTSLITVLLISQHLKICFAVRCFCCNNIFSSVFGDQ